MKFSISGGEIKQASGREYQGRKNDFFTGPL
jgi:hypothetical protein